MNAGIGRQSSGSARLSCSPRSRLHRADRPGDRPDETRPCRETLTAGTAVNRCRERRRSRTVAGQERRCAARVAAPPPNGSSSSGLATTTVCARLPAPKPDRKPADATHDAWQDADSCAARDPRSGCGCRETLLLIEGVRCTACVWLIERSLGAVPGVVSVQVNAAARRARVIWRDSKIDAAATAADALARTGYRALPLDAGGTRRCAAQRVARRAQAAAGRRASARCRP